jgi:F-type H+-transporting ATPase subunit alpha
MQVVDQVLIIYAASGGHLDQVPIPEVKAWEEKFLTFMRDQKPEVRDAIHEKQDLDDELTTQIDASIAEFKMQYDASSARQPVQTDVAAEPALA